MNLRYGDNKLGGRCALGAIWLSPVYEARKARLLGYDVLHADETAVQVLREPGRRAQSKSWMWMYRTGCGTENGIVVYEYQPGRKGICEIVP